MKKVGIVLFIVALWTVAANAAQSVIGVNFCEGDTTDHLAGETADGLSNWTDSTGSNNGTGLEVLETDSMVTCDWASSNTWRGGNNTTREEQLYHAYLDDGSGGPDITISGLSAWLNAVGASSYTIRIYQCTDHGPNSGYTFGETEITDGANVLETLQIQMGDVWTTNNNDMRGFVDSNELTNDTIHIQGYGPPSGGNIRGCIAGFKITAVRGVVAQDPSPVDGEEDVVVDTELTWSPGIYAVTHDVYFGTDFDDVNAATTSSILLVSADQDANTYKPPNRLEFGQTYYWRIDEVNAPSDPCTYKGKVWSFTTEPEGYPIPGENIIATASSFTIENTEQGSEQTVNGSGLEDDLHSNIVADMWLSAGGADEPAWIQYDFDKDYNLNQMLVWNYNGQGLNTFLGIREATVAYYTDENGWTEVNDVPEFAQALGEDGYANDIVVDLGGVTAWRVKITAVSNWSGGLFDQFGLSEVRFLYIPLSARNPVPASGQMDVALDAVLSWRAGRDATMHDVYIGTSEQEVTEANIPTESISAEGSEVDYAPPFLALGQRYYWKVVEIGDSPDSEVWASDIWNFSTIQHFVVDDFEDYNDYSPNEVFNTWIDGYDDASNGSTAGYPDPDFVLGEHYMETGIVHGGEQSMPLSYDNTGTVAYSEVSRRFDTSQDWTVKDVQMLTLFLRGNPPAFAEASIGSILMSGIGADIYQTTDEFNFAYKSLTGNGSITLRIDSIQYTHEWAKAGVMIRSSLEPLAQQVHMIGAASNRIEWMYRTTAGGGTSASDTGVDSITFPHWVRIRREGNTFIGEHSVDGVNWTTTTPGVQSSSSVTIQMPNTVYIGMVVTSHVSDEICQAEFSEVSTTGNVTGQWQLADIGVEQSDGNRADRLYVIVEDNIGRAETYEHPDNPNAVQIGDWQQWDIPLSVFSDAGVNLRSVRKMTIGIGDRTAPLHGAGLLFVDDIWLFTPLPPLSDANDM